MKSLLPVVALMGQAYYQFSKEYPEYLRLIHFCSSERFSKENPYTAEIGMGYSTCRTILRDAIQEAIDDGTIGTDLDPFLTSMYPCPSPIDDPRRRPHAPHLRFAPVFCVTVPRARRSRRVLGGFNW
jgi:hypothetical protein